MLFHQPHNSLTNYAHNAVFYTNTIWKHHFHKNMELVYVIEGTLNCVVNNAAYSLKQGDFGLCLPYDIHSYTPECDTRYWVFVFSDDFIRYFSTQIAGRIGGGFGFHPDVSVRAYIEEHLVNRDDPSIFIIKACLYAICEEYTKSISLIPRDTKHKELITLITEYISQHHTQKITLSGIAQTLGYDYNYMSRFFRKTFNMSFSDFVNVYRLETAIDLLVHTDYNVTRISFESGFQSVRSFNDFFRKNTGMNPTQYRKHLSSTPTNRQTELPQNPFYVTNRTIY